MKFALGFALLLTVGLVLADDPPGFFLKSAKNVPRVRMQLSEKKTKSHFIFIAR